MRIGGNDDGPARGTCATVGSWLPTQPGVRPPWWFTEAVPMTWTSLLPLVLVPALTVCRSMRLIVLMTAMAVSSVGCAHGQRPENRIYVISEDATEVLAR